MTKRILFFLGFLAALYGMWFVVSTLVIAGYGWHVLATFCGAGLFLLLTETALKNDR